jgi:alpha-tubulin suppressor-like RCC1 family protein
MVTGMKKIFSLSLAIVIMVTLLPVVAGTAQPSEPEPAVWGDLPGIKQVSARYRTMAIKTDGTLWAWGRDLGFGDSVQVPMQVGSDTDWAYVSVGNNMAGAIKTDGSLWIWGNGSNHYPNLGIVIATPTQFGVATDWASVFVGSYFFYAIKTDGSLWTWGNNNGGYLGIGNTTNPIVTSPVQVGTDTDWASVNGKIAIKTDGSMWSWGQGAFHLGQGDLNHRFLPAQIGTDFDWVSTTGHRALKTDGSIWTWGVNTNFTLGLGDDTEDKSAPVRLGTDNDWAGISDFTSNTGVAIKTNGSLWVWGLNLSGGLGVGDSIRRTTPTQLGTDNDWASVRSGYSSTYAIKTDGSLWAWGGNSWGQLGDGTTTNRNTPVRIWPTADSTLTSCDECKKFECECPSEPDDPDDPIDPGDPTTDTLLPAKTFSFKSGKTIPADAAPLAGAYINTTAKTLTIPSGYNIEAYSTDGGMTWTAGNLTPEAFAKLFDKSLELWLCFKDFNPNAGKPQGSGDAHNIIAFDFIPLTISSPTPGAVINLTSDTIALPAGFTVAAFSTDGGKKWKRGELPNAARFPRLLNKGMTLHVTSDFDRKGKKPTADAETITFPEIAARPKRNADKLRPSYGETHWVLAKKGSTAAVFAGLEYAPSSNGRTPDDGNWIPMPQDGIAVTDSRDTYLVRTAPTVTRAASTAWRVRTASFGKAPNLKVKNDEITVNAGMYVKLPDGTVTLHREKKKIPAVTGMEIWRAANGKKPASEVQTLTR